ncbi:MAG: hypothetical protein R6W83_02345, partial [Cryobacterium sp.]
AYDDETHPEWCMRREDGGFVARDWPVGAHPDDPKPTFQWKLLCPGVSIAPASRLDRRCGARPPGAF